MRRLLLILFVICATTMTYAQQDGSQRLFDTFEQRFVALDSLIFATAEADTATADHPAVHFQHWWIAQDSTSTADSLITNQVNAEVRAMKHETGLALTGQTYYRLDEGLALDEDDAVSRYKAKVQVELRWNFLNSSLIHRQGRQQAIELQGDIERIEMDKANLARLLAENQEFYQQKYDSLLSGILQHRLVNLTLMNDAQMYLLEHGNISSDEMLDIINDKAEAERALMAMSKTYPMTNDLSHPSGLVVEIDSAGLLGYIREHHADLHLLQLQSELLAQQMENHSYWTKLNISPFIRYSYYFRTELANSTNVDFGVNFNIPITGEAGKKRAAMDAKRMIIDKEKEETTKKIEENIRAILLDIERLNRVSTAELHRMQDLKRYLQIRSHAYLNRKGGYNIILRTKEYNTYLVCWEKFLSYQYQRDCLLMSLQTYLTDTSIFDFCVGTII
mgnify:CR=1 FL=1